MRNQFGEIINPTQSPRWLQRMGLRGTFITFEEREPKPKTKVWAVLSQSGGEIGTVCWYGPWRKYCFMPIGCTVFEQVCLREIAQFCETATRNHKQPNDKIETNKAVQKEERNFRVQAQIFQVLLRRLEAQCSADTLSAKEALKKEIARIVDDAFTAGFDADNAGALSHFDGFAAAEAAIEKYWPNNQAH